MMMQPVYSIDPYNPGSNAVIPVGSAPMGVQMPRFGGIQYVMVEDPMTELGNCSHVIIKQQPELLEAITGCETANRYHVFGNSGGYFKYLFKCQELSSFCERNCCPSSLREFNMQINHVASSPMTGGLSKSFANAFKPFKCSCLCLNRPVISVTLGSDNRYIGKIVHLFTCCDPEFEVYNSHGLKYYIRADCCQCGLLCANNICGKFSTAQFDIHQPGSANIIANIQKMSAQSYGEAMTDADSYQVGFPPGATPEDKLLLITLGLMIDYQYFETSSSDDNRSGYGYRYY